MGAAGKLPFHLSLALLLFGGVPGCYGSLVGYGHWRVIPPSPLGDYWFYCPPYLVQCQRHLVICGHPNPHSPYSPYNPYNFYYPRHCFPMGFRPYYW